MFQACPPRPPLLLFILLLQALASCSVDKSPPLRLGFNAWLGFAPIHVAEDLGLLDTTAVEVYDVSNTNQLLRGLATGTLDGAGMTLEGVMDALDLGIDLVVILVTDVSAGGDMVIAAPGFDSLAAVKGMRVGAEDNSLGDLMLQRAAAAEGLAASDFERVDVSFQNHARAFREGRIDAIVTAEPVGTQLIQAGGNLVFSSAQIPGEIVDVLVVTREAMGHSPERIAHVSQAWFAAVASMTTDPGPTLPLIDKRAKLGIAGVQHAMASMHFPDQAESNALLANNGERVQLTIHRIQQIMLARGKISENLPVNDLFNADIAAQAR